VVDASGTGYVLMHCIGGATTDVDEVGFGANVVGQSIFPPEAA